MKYIYYMVDGEKQEIEAKNPMPLDQIQSLVGGHIEGLALTDGTYLFINETGALDNLPLNPAFLEGNPILPDVLMDGGIRGNVVRGRIDEVGDFIGI